MTDLLTVAQASGRASVCETVVRRWVASGRLAHFRLGARGRGKIAIDPADLDALLATFRVEARRPEATPEPAPPPARPATPFRHLRVK